MQSGLVGSYARRPTLALTSTTTQAATVPWIFLSDVFVCRVRFNPLLTLYCRERSMQMDASMFGFLR